jgi:pimeloyl-ACP methyl ester carboxylesterase
LPLLLQRLKVVMKQHVSGKTSLHRILMCGAIGFWLSLVLTFVMERPSFAQSWSKAHHAVLMPVFYVTDRKDVSKPSGVEFDEDIASPHPRLVYGVRYVAWPWPDNQVGELPDLEKIGWKELERKRSEQSISKEEIASFEATARGYSRVFPDGSDFLSRIESYRTSRPSAFKQEILLYVHGFYNNFGAATDKGAELQASFKVPTIAYAWTTPTKHLEAPSFRHVPYGIAWPKFWRSYRQSEVTFQQSVDRFDDFATKLVERSQPGNIVIVGHSMGTRLVEQFLLSSTSDKRFREVVLSNPDIDANEFANHCGRLASTASTFRIYYNKNDQAMEAAKSLHGNQPRLGAAPDDVRARLADAGIQMIEMTNIGSDDLEMSGHRLVSWLVGEMHKYNSPDLNGKHFRLDWPHPNTGVITKVGREDN